MGGRLEPLSPIASTTTATDHFVLQWSDTVGYAMQMYVCICQNDLLYVILAAIFTYYMLGGTLNPIHSLTHCIIFMGHF